MSSARCKDGKIVDGTAQMTDMMARAMVRVDLGTYMGLPH